MKQLLHVLLLLALRTYLASAQCAVDADCMNGVCNQTLLTCDCTGTGYTGDLCETDINECDTDNGGCAQNCNNVPGTFHCTCDDGYTTPDNGITCSDINECNTNNGGCAQNCNNVDGTAFCTCDPGYETADNGKTCTDIDECSSGTHNCAQTCTNAVATFSCSCLAGYSTTDNGVTCNDIDECATDDGGCDHTCTNNDGSFVCSCDTGYMLNADGRKCDDINECDTNNGGCDQNCVNIVATFFCTCDDGYTTPDNGITCNDINECLADDNAGCAQTCVNTPSTFFCACLTGYTTPDAGITCNDIDECLDANGGCQQNCNNVPGSFSCSCDTGYSTPDDGVTCNDINECEDGSNGGCDHTCTNNAGSFVCTCDTGYSTPDDGFTCNDIDECATDNGGCDQTCTNSAGSFTCTCAVGYSTPDNGFTCNDINECDTDNGGCDHTCTNTDGSFFCTCDSGYVTPDDGFTCNDIDECATGNGGCAQTCNNVPGSYFCTCLTGYVTPDNGFTCNDIDECATGNGGCDQTCTNTIGSFFCTCLTGYSTPDDGFTCNDIDECATNNGGCGHNCTNNDGSFVCSCVIGYSLDSDGFGCTDINECDTNNGECWHDCTNNVGSYVCSCVDGYQVDSNDISTCLDIDECKDNLHSCDQTCINHNGGYICDCDRGCSLDGEFTCVDENECEDGTAYCTQGCTNKDCTDGRYECFCAPGYKLYNDDYTCIDIDECEDRIDNCTHNCVNVVGSYHCMCNDGCTLHDDGVSCTDIDECLTNNGGCNDICINLDCSSGKYECDCRDGYSLGSDGHNCIDVNECDDPNANECEQGCVNQLGTYECVCQPGCSLDADGFKCSDVDECALVLHGCEHVCNNEHCLDGGHYCSCFPGYKLRDDELTCADINECADNNGGCQHTCTNTMPFYFCTCDYGYELGNDNHSCNPLPCPTLYEPSNGTITCTGNPMQVTGETCSFDCDLGFYLSGPETLLCLNSSMWTGEDSSCPPLLCGALETDPISQLSQPCYDFFPSVCSHVCANGYYLAGSTTGHYERACVVESPTNVEWTPLKMCSAYSPCDLSPCQNGGICTETEYGINCDCPAYFKGEFCEAQEMITPTLPFLDLYVQSDFLYINITTTHSDVITINLLSSGMIDFSPSNQLEIAPGTKSTAFRMTPLESGVLFVEYDIQASSTFDKPNNGHLLVYPRNGTNYFASNGLENGILAPGCCSRDTVFSTSYCTDTSRHVSLSSSCGWSSSSETTFATDGLTFVHIGETALPLSIVSLDATLSPTVLDLLPANLDSECVACTDSVVTSERCYNWDMSIEDTKGMTQSGSLLKTLLHRILDLLPSNVSITSTFNFQSEPYGHSAMLVDAAELTSLAGCEFLSGSLNGLMYIMRSHSDVTANVRGDLISYSSILTRNPFCFAIGICQLPQAPLHVRLPNEASNSFTKLSAFNSYLAADWIISVRSTSLSYYGLDAFQKEWFWNGTDLITLYVPYYDVSLWMSVQGSMSLVDHTIDFSFSGTFYSLVGYDEEIPNRLYGDCSIDITTVFLSATEAIHFESASCSGVFINSLKLAYNDDQLVKGAGLDVLFSSADQGSRIKKVFSTEGPCLVSAYIHYDDSIKPQWTSLYTSCIDIHVGSLVFAGLASRVMLPASTNAGPESTDVILKVWSNNPSDRVISLGKFVAFTTTSSDSAYLELTLTSDELFTGAFSSAAVSLFDTTFNTNITIGESQINFASHANIFGYYPTYLTGSANLDNAWEALVLNIDGVMNSDADGFVSELEAYVHRFIDASATEAVLRRDTATTNRDRAKAMLVAAEANVATKQSAYDALSTELAQLTDQQAFWTSIKDENNQLFDNLIAIYGQDISQAQYDDINGMCNETVCGQLCQYNKEVAQCSEDTDVPTYMICSQDDTTSRQVHAMSDMTMYYCENVENCDTELGVQLATDVTGSLPVLVPFALLMTNCFDVCEQREMVEKVVDFETSDYIKTGYMVCEGGAKPVSSTAVCWINTTCGSYLDEEPCLTLNQECMASKKQATIDATGVTGTGLAQLNTALTDYNNAYNSESASKADVYQKVIEREVARQELFMAEKARDSASLVEQLSIDAYTQVLGSLDVRYMQWLSDYNSSANIVQLNSISFSTSVVSSSPSELLLKVSYTLPYLNNAEYEKEIVVDLGDTVEIVKDNLLDFIITSIIADEANQPGKRSADTKTESILGIKYACASLQWLLEYLELINGTLNESRASTTSVLQSTSEEIKAIQELIDLVIAEAESAGLSDIYRLNLAQYQQAYLNQATESYNGMGQSVWDVSLHYWMLNTERYHSGDGITLADSNCFSLTDCLFLLLRDATILLDPLGGPEANNLKAALPGMYGVLQSIASTSDTSILELQNNIWSLYQFVKGIESLGFYCSDEPVITTHPDPEVFAFYGNTVTLSCKASSTLPLTYQWLKDDVLIAGYNSPDLVINNFQAQDKGTYRCQAVNGIARISSLPSVLSNYQAPVITLQPLDQARYDGDELSARFVCQAESNVDLAPYWSWYYKGLEDEAWNKIVNATSNFLIIDTPNLSDEGWYWCVAENRYNSTQSRPARLWILGASVVTRRYPIQFTIDASLAPNDTDIIMVASEEYLQNQIQVNSASIINLSLWPHSIADYFIVYFELSGIPVSVESFISKELPHIVSDTMDAFKCLETTRSSIVDTINGGPSYDEFDIIQGSVVQDTVIYYCLDGQELRDDYFICLSCPPGYYSSGYVTDYRSRQPLSLDEALIPVCSACPLGSYQNEQGSKECLTCPEYYTTTSEGSTECTSLCSPHTYSSNGLSPCTPCEGRSYQPEYGARKCLVCDYNPSNLSFCDRPPEPSSSGTPTATPTSTSSPIGVGIITAIAIGCFVIAILLIVILILFLFICVRKTKEKQMIEEYRKGHLPEQEDTHPDKGLEDFENRLEATQEEESAFIVTEMTDFGVLESPGGSERKLGNRESSSTSDEDEDSEDDEDITEKETFIN